MSITYSEIINMLKIRSLYETFRWWKDNLSKSIQETDNLEQFAQDTKKTLTLFYGMSRMDKEVHQSIILLVQLLVKNNIDNNTIIYFIEFLDWKFEDVFKSDDANMEKLMDLISH